jgi:hypothetical protein
MLSFLRFCFAAESRGRIRRVGGEQVDDWRRRSEDWLWQRSSELRAWRRKAAIANASSAARFSAAIYPERIRERVANIRRRYGFDRVPPPPEPELLPREGQMTLF